MEEKFIRRKVSLKINADNDNTGAGNIEIPAIPKPDGVYGVADAQDGHHPSDKLRAMCQKIGRCCLFAIAFLAPVLFLPFTANPLEANKTVIIGVLAIVACIVFLILSILARRIYYPKSLLPAAVGVFVVFQGISSYFSAAPAMSFWGGLRQSDSFLNTLIFGLIFFLSFYFFERADIKKVGTFCFAGLSFATIIGLFQIFGIFLFPWSFTKSVAFNPVGSVFAWGICMAMGIAVAATAKFEALSPRERKIMIGFAVLMGVGLFALNNQMLWLICAFATVIVAAFRFADRGRLQFPLIVVIVALFFTLIGPRLPAMANIPLEVRPSVQTTFSIATQTASGWRSLMGSGPSTFYRDFSLFRPQILNQTNFWQMTFLYGYDYPLTLLATCGILGLLAFLFLVFAAFRILWKPFINHFEDYYLAMAFMGTVFLLFMSFFYPAFFAGFVFMFIGMGLVARNGRIGSFSLEWHLRWKTFLAFIVMLFLIAVGFSALYVIGQKYAAAIAYGKYETASSAGNLDVSLARINSALTLDPQNDEYLRAASTVALAKANQLFPSGGLQSSGFQSAIVSALQTGQSAAKINPGDVTNWMNLGSIYEAVIPIANGAVASAQASYEKAEALDPQNPAIPAEIAKVIIVSADSITATDSASQNTKRSLYSTAMVTLQKSIALKPDYAVAEFLIAQFYMKEGDINGSLQEAAVAKIASPNDAGLAFQLGLLYYQNNEIDQAQEEFERAVGIDSNYSNARYFLGLIYANKGFTSQATAQFQKISVLNPDNTEVKAIIQNLQNGKPALQGVVASTAPSVATPGTSAVKTKK